MADSLVQALAAAQAAANAELNLVGEEDDDDEMAGIEEEEEDDDDEDIDAEAQEIARRLGQQLWEDINKAQAAQAALHIPPPSQKQSRKEEAVILTMKTILTLVDQDPAARVALEATILPGHGGSVLGLLQQSVSANGVDKHMCMPLSHTLVSLAKSEALFGGLRHSNMPSLELDKGKRRREEGDENIPPNDQRPFKRPFVPDGDLYSRMTDAVRVITQALAATPPQALDPVLVASIRLQLHQVFLFAVTSSARGGHEMHALQEISGLIQVIGVLSGIQIGQPPERLSNQPPYTNSSYPWMDQLHTFPPTTDIGTAVYPCLIAGCGKTFSRLYGLRAHQRSHSTHRPFRCVMCPASFARNHDLKRHVRLHDKKAWKCGGCQKIFSRRDAIKRHKNGSKTRGPKSEICINAEVLEVDLDEEDGEDSLREERRAKLWNTIAAHGINAPQVSYRDSGILEEGELPPAIIANTQAVVLSLQGLLQSHVGSALGTPPGQAAPANNDPTNGQATLASVIARAQMHAHPAKQTSAPGTTGGSAPTPTSSAIPATTSTENPGPQDIAMASPKTADQEEMPTMPSLSMYGLSDEQAKMLELAVASAASAAQAQAEAEAALEEEEEDTSGGDDSDSTDEQETMS
ncbi:Transcriptional regulator prz1 [Leucoagaricus sp. SymC.cos]|nr:Transcriptional regulator prz1 [Leucoagaricus sp. SymC.cos]